MLIQDADETEETRSKWRINDRQANEKNIQFDYRMRMIPIVKWPLLRSFSSKVHRMLFYVHCHLEKFTALIDYKKNQHLLNVLGLLIDFPRFLQCAASVHCGEYRLVQIVLFKGSAYTKKL